MSLGIRIPAQINRALRTAAEWASDHDIGTERARRRVVLGALIVVYAAILGARELGRLVRREWAIVVVGLALAIPVAALEYRSHPAARTTDEPVSFGPAPAAVTENEPAGAGMNESGEENARMAEWKRSVQQALKEPEAREQARQQEAARPEHGVDAPAARNVAAQEEKATRTDSGAAREPAKKQAETVSASNPPSASGEVKAAAETKAASGSSVAEEANAANDAKPANETKGPEPSSDSDPTAGVQDGQTASASRLNGWGRRTENYRETKDTDGPEIARRNAIARHALTYSWVTTDRAGHRWLHIRSIHHGP